MKIHNLIEKLRELEAVNANFECRVYVHGADSDGEDQSLHSDELPSFEFDLSDPDSVMIDFYSANWRQKPE
jgi:hypothetical protein